MHCRSTFPVCNVWSCRTWAMRCICGPDVVRAAPSPMSIVTPTAPYKPDAHKPVTNSVSKPSASRKTSAFLTTTSAPATRSSSSLPKQPLASAGKRKSPEKSQPSSTVKSASASLPSPQDSEEERSFDRERDTGAWWVGDGALRAV
eukprot:1441718-Rhodomonas_salina.2